MFFRMLDFLKQRLEDDREYQILVEREEDGTFVATSPTLPGFVAYGPSEVSAARKLRRAIQRNMEGFADDWVQSSVAAGEHVSRHKHSLHFGLPLTTTAKVVLSSLALATAAGLVKLSLKLRR
jgi:predicted RNase H-like HicB family nuclease